MRLNSSYDFGWRSPQSLANSGCHIVGVVTKSEKSGHTQLVADWARRKKIPLLAPVSPRSGEFIRQVQHLHFDLIVVAGYHKVIPKAVLDIPPLGIINVHAGLLPQYRGPCTWKWAIVNGETRTGVSVHVMTPALDSGDILAQRAFAISDEDTGGSLFEKFSVHGAQLLVETLEKLQQGHVNPVVQTESLASNFSYPNDDDACISWQESAKNIRNLIRGLNPSPGAWLRYRGIRLVIGSAELQRGTCSAEPGRILDWDDSGIKVGTCTQDLAIRQLQLEDKLNISINGAVKKLVIVRGDYFESKDIGTNTE